MLVLSEELRGVTRYGPNDCPPEEVGERGTVYDPPLPEPDPEITWYN